MSESHTLQPALPQRASMRRRGGQESGAFQEKQYTSGLSRESTRYGTYSKVLHAAFLRHQASETRFFVSRVLD